MLNRSLIGQTSSVGEIDVERLHLKMFCQGIGETNPIYFDKATAQAAGYPDAVAPPTFFSALENYLPLTGGILDVPLPVENLLHAEQGYTYLRPVFAGETLILQSTITDIYEKKGGALEFIEYEITARKKNDGEIAVKMFTSLVLRHKV